MEALKYSSKGKGYFDAQLPARSVDGVDRHRPLSLPLPASPVEGSGSSPRGRGRGRGRGGGAPMNKGSKGDSIKEEEWEEWEEGGVAGE